MRNLIRAVACLSLLLLALQARSQAAESSLQQVIADFERFSREVDPITAGFEGDREALRRLPDVRPEAQEGQRKQLVAFRERLAKIDALQLSGKEEFPEEVALNHLLLTHIVNEAIAEIGFDFSRIAFQNDDGFHTLADYLGRTTTVASRADADAWLALLGGPLPLDILEVRVGQWIEKTRGGE